MACAIIVIVVYVSIFVGLALSALYFYDAHASTANGTGCEVPENADQIEEVYRSRSDSAVSNWKLESVNVGCGGSISASYILPEFSEKETTFKVILQLEPLQIHAEDEEDLFPADFIEQHDVSVSKSISSIMSNYIFKAVDEEFTNKTISFYYGTSSYFHIFAYKNFETCRSDFEVDMLNPELLDLSISNDADIYTIQLIKVAREHASNHLQNISAGAMAIRNASNNSCGLTTVYTSYSMDNNEMAPLNSYTATVDIECDETVLDNKCPEEIKLVYGTTFQLPITSSIIYSATATPSSSADTNSENISNPSKQEADDTNAWATAIVPIGIGSAIAGAAVFVMFRRLA